LNVKKNQMLFPVTKKKEGRHSKKQSRKSELQSSGVLTSNFFLKREAGRRRASLPRFYATKGKKKGTVKTGRLKPRDHRGRKGLHQKKKERAIEVGKEGPKQRDYPIRGRSPIEK